MKKILFIILVIAMIATMSVTAFAADASPKVLDNANVPGSAVINVEGVYNRGEQLHTYKIVINWQAFTYTFISGETWNPETHKWDLTGGDGRWTIEDKNITITNHSSQPVKATASYLPTLPNTDFEFGNNEVTVPSAVGTAVDAAPSEKIVCTFKPGTATIQANNTPLGTLTVTIE